MPSYYAMLCLCEQEVKRQQCHTGTVETSARQGGSVLVLLTFSHSLSLSIGSLCLFHIDMQQSWLGYLTALSQAFICCGLSGIVHLFPLLLPLCQDGLDQAPVVSLVAVASLYLSLTTLTYREHTK